MTSKVPCADFGANDEKLIEYLTNHQLLLLSADSFINYDEVEPFRGPVKYTVKIVDILPGKLFLEPGIRTIKQRMFSNIEHRVSLQDSLI